MPSWKEENLRAFTERLGRWISWSYQSDGLGEFFNPLICLDTTDWNEISEDMKILYRGNKRDIHFIEIKDEKSLYGKVLPMEFSQDVKDKPDKQDRRENKESVEPNYKDKEEVNQSQVDQSQVDQDAVVGNNVNDNETLKTSEEAHNSKAAEVYKGKEVQGSSMYKDFRLAQSSSDKLTEEKEEVVESTRSILSVERGMGEMDNSQSTLCVGLSKKLKVKSNRGRPRKKVVHPRNPFEISSKFSFRKSKRMGQSTGQRRRRKEARVSHVEVVPTGMVGSSVKEALEIIASTENMGLTILGERAVVVKEIVKRLERKEL